MTTNLGRASTCRSTEVRVWSREIMRVCVSVVLAAMFGVLLTALLVALIHRKLQLSLVEEKVSYFLFIDWK